MTLVNYVNALEGQTHNYSLCLCGCLYCIWSKILLVCMSAE